MPIILDDKELDKLFRLRKIKKGRAVKPSKKAERELMRRMSELWSKLLFPATARIRRLIEEKADIQFIADEIENTLRWANAEYAQVSEDIVAKWRMSLDLETRQKLNEGLKRTLGIDTSIIFDDSAMADALRIGTMEASNLIKSIPSQYLGQVAQAVADNYMGKGLPEGRSLLQQIQQIHKVSEKRAKLIARDQTSKLTGVVNQVRQTSIGIEEYIWRTADDQRVVGNPTGLYPDGNRVHGNHYKRNGVKFRWDSPPEDGHPGQAIQCRCHAEPIIDPQKIAAHARRS